MVKHVRDKTLAAIAAALIAATTLAPIANAAAVQAPFAQQLRDTQVRGLLPGGQFSKIWLGLQPEQPGATVTVTAEWDRPDADNSGIGFFILDDSGLRGIGESSLSSLAIGAGSQSFFLNGPSNQQGASILVPGMAQYTIILFNDSAADANFTLTASGATILDDSGQVTGVNSTAATPESSSEEVAEAGTEEAPAPPPAAETPAPVATTAATTVTTETTTTETVATTPVATEAPAAPATTTAPAVTREVRATTMRGDLPEQDNQHFLGLVPDQRDGNISLMLTFDPQDNSELARRLNFWVLDESGFTQYLRGTNPGEVAIAAGNRTFRGDTNERVANFKAVGLGQYTIIVYNNSRVPGSYTLTVEGGLLVDDSGQTITAQQAGVGSSTTVTGTTTTETTVAGSTTTTTTDTTTTTTTTTTPPTTGTTTTTSRGEPGGTYTVQSGDTLALIARDVYGDYRFYEQICAFNNIANCNVIEVGDVINLPTQAQLQSGATSTTSTTTTAATATPAATTAATTTTTAATPAATPTASATVTSTTTAPATRAGATTTGSTTAPITTTTGTTTTATTTATTTGATTTATSGETIVDALVADGRFTSLVEALEATGLDSVLDSGGPFTVFAPTDAAFAALPAGAFDQLLNDPSGQLTDILRYHVIAGRTLSEDLSNSMLATTVQGKSVRFEVQGNTVRINGATLITKDIETDNGVVQVIDAVILPPPE